MNATLSGRIVKVLIFGSITLGVIARSIGMTWSGGSIKLHPDEELIITHAQSISFFSNLDPGFYDYNGLLVYLGAIISRGATFTTGVVPTAGTLAQVARVVSAVASLGTIALLYRLTQTLYNKQTALLATAFFATSLLPIQLAHFYTTDATVTLLFVGILLGCSRWYQTRKRRYFLTSTILLGLAIGTKTTAILFYPILFFTIMLIWAKEKRLDLLASNLLYALTIPFLVFLFVSPYSFLNMPEFINRSVYLQEIVSGKRIFNWTLQFLDTNGLFWIPNVFVATGPIVPLVSAIGFGYALVGAIKKHRWYHGIVLLWSVGFAVFLGVTYLKFIRYMLPLTPIIAMGAAIPIQRLISRFPRVGGIFAAILLITSMVMAAAFAGIYLREHPAVAASAYIVQTAPYQSTILQESWNEELPLTDVFPEFGNYRHIYVDLYAAEREESLRWLANQLSAADYFIMSSQKVRLTIERLSSRYPGTTAFYKRLFAGSLGYTKEKEFSSPLRIGPWVISDLAGEETFRIFDHPTVMIFKNTHTVSEEQIYTQIGYGVL